MAKVREYTVVVNGQETTMQLNEADAKQMGAKPVQSGTQTSADVEEKARTTANKSRSAENK